MAGNFPGSPHIHVFVGFFKVKNHAVYSNTNDSHDSKSENH